MGPCKGTACVCLPHQFSSKCSAPGQHISGPSSVSEVYPLGWDLVQGCRASLHSACPGLLGPRQARGLLTGSNLHQGRERQALEAITPSPPPPSPLPTLRFGLQITSSTGVPGLALHLLGTLEAPWVLTLLCSPGPHVGSWHVCLSPGRICKGVVTIRRSYSSKARSFF